MNNLYRCNHCGRVFTSSESCKINVPCIGGYSYDVGCGYEVEEFCPNCNSDDFDLISSGSIVK